VRKAQGGMNAAILVAIIGGLIILYIVFLPDSEREALLENKSVSKSGSSDDDDTILLRVFPGRLDIVEDIENKQIPNIFLFESTNAKELERINAFIVRNGWLDTSTKIIDFDISDFDNTENVIFSFQTKKNDGILTIKLNNEIIFESDIDQQTPGPVKLRKDDLLRSNTLELSLSGVGAKFWKTNEYTFEDVKIIGDITDKTKQQSRNIFTLTGTELSNIEEANLRFVPYCSNVADVGTLEISVNGRNLFSAVPVCEDSYKQPLPLNLLETGENNIVFKTNKGSYSVEQIRIDFEEEELKSNVYFFEVNQSTIDEREDDDDKDFILTIEFVDDDENKRADLNINDRLSSIDEEDRIFTKNLNNFIEEGNNFIELRPRNRLDVREIKVALEEK